MTRPLLPAALSLDEEERGRGVRRFCEKAQALGLDAVTPHGAEHVGEALGAVNEGEAPAIAQHTLRRGADVVQRAGGFLARDLRASHLALSPLPAGKYGGFEIT